MPTRILQRIPFPRYNPDLENDIATTYRMTPTLEFSIEGVASEIVAESSTGTWTTLYPSYDIERVRRLSARAYEILT
ncbi:hypothetical protein [Thermofilum sp.]|uniref:hypothetical protein n=1 Tax=Thermofilum sp. TaxID=1961369 RepID=UPI003163CA85